MSKNFTGIVERIRNASSHDELHTLVSTLRTYRFASQRTINRCKRAASIREIELITGRKDESSESYVIHPPKRKVSR